MAVEFPAAYWKDYELLDSGNGEKLERFGKYVLRRPEPKALWAPSLPEAEWKRLTHVLFTPGAGFGKAGKEDSGTWERSKKMEDQWSIAYNGEQDPETHAASDLHIALRLGLTSFKHVGVFPEQAPNWEFIYRETSRLVRIHKANGLPAPRVLNLFAYTGAASLAAKCAGADVTHLDSVRQVVTWARNEEIEFIKKYKPEEYPHYDNYDAIEVSKTQNIPEDYDGVMGVPITFLDKYNPNQFEILGITDRGNEYGLKTKEYTKEMVPNAGDLNRRAAYFDNGVLKATYARLLIRIKQ